MEQSILEHRDIKKVALVYNPISGRGKSVAASKRIQEHLEQRGVGVELLGPVREMVNNGLVSHLESIDALLVAGGDGTLRDVLPTLFETKTPVYLIPTGTESLFAREFSMSKSPSVVLDTIEAGSISKHYVAEANGLPFFTMVSIGLDSEVIFHISEVRNGPINHLHYVGPIFKSIWKHKAPRFSMAVDGKKVLEEVQGLLIIANNKQYALRIGYVPEADSETPELCARFFPYKSVWKYGVWAVRCMMGRPLNLGKDYFFRGEEFKIEMSEGEQYPVQADGEYIGSTPLHVKLSPETIYTLRPQT